MIAVIAGATGLTGQALLQDLLKDSNIERVLTVGRRRAGLENPKLTEILVSDLAEIQQHAKELVGDIYFSCLGTTIKAAGSKDAFAKVDYTAVIDFARVAKQNHAQVFTLVSASSANSSSPIFYSQIKGETEEVIKKLGLDRVIIFQPGLLMGERKVKRIGEKIASAVLTTASPFFSATLKKRLMTPVDHLAKRMIQESFSKIASPIKTIAAVDI
jgi:uncharacterized protein YbjT (DUF2867 family)